MPNNGSEKYRIFRITKMNGEEIPKSLYCKSKRDLFNPIKHTVEIWDYNSKKLQKQFSVNDDFFDRLAVDKSIKWMTEDQLENFYIEYTEVPISRLQDID